MEEKEKYWSRFAENFEESNNYVVGIYDVNLVSSELAKLQNLRNTLELACGNGTYSKVLCRNAGNYIATDFSDEMVDASVQRLKDYKNIKVEKANAFSLQYSDQSFDTVFMANLLHIVPNPEKILLEAKRVLKNSGKLIVLDYTGDGMKFIHKLGMIYRYLKTYGKPPSGGTKLGMKDIRELLVMHGFVMETVSLIGKRSKAVIAVCVKAK